MNHSTGQDCVFAWESMPHALHGRLPQAQAEWLEGHLAGCESCRAQFAKERRLQRAMMLPAGMPADAEAGLQALLARIDRPDVPTTATPAITGGWAGRALVAAVLLQAIGLGVMGAKLWSLEPAPAYRTYSQETPVAAAASIRLVPDPAMSVADWDALLRAHGLQVVAGPNEVGAYTVVPASTSAGREALIRQLRANVGIRLAEPVAGTP